MRKTILLSALAFFALGSFLAAGEITISKMTTISEDMPMLCPKCGKYHKPTTPCS